MHSIHCNYLLFQFKVVLLAIFLLLLLAVGVIAGTHVVSLLRGSVNGNLDGLLRMTIMGNIVACRKRVLIKKYIPDTLTQRVVDTKTPMQTNTQNRWCIFACH